MKASLKITTLLCLITHWPIVYGQSEGGASASGNNSVLRDNAINSRTYLEQQAQKEKDRELTQEEKYQNMVKGGTGTIRSRKADAENYDQAVKELTPQEQQLANYYVHEGYLNRSYDEACKSLDSSGKTCKGQAQNKFMGIDSNMVQALSKGYTMIIGSMSIGGGGDLTTSKEVPKSEGTQPGANGANGTDQAAGTTKQQGKMHDYCKYISMGTEGLAMFNQNTKQQEIENRAVDQANAQKENLYKVAESYEERAKNSQISAMGFTGTAACYGAMMGFAGVQMDMSTGLKMGAAAMLGMFYWNESKQHKSNAEKVRSVADGLPGMGDCNPISARSCYCAQPETLNDPVYCLPQQVAKSVTNGTRVLKAGEIPVACTDENMAIDAECHCEKRGTCLNLAKKITSQFNLSTPGFAADGNKAVSPTISQLLNGKLVTADLQQGSLSANAARSYLQQLENRLPNPSNSAVTASNDFKAMQELGMPPKFAAHLASQPMNAQAQKYADQLQASLSSGRWNPAIEQVTASAPSRTLTFGSDGGGLNARRNPAAASSGFDIKNLKTGKADNSNRMLEFAEKAQQRAQISNRPDHKIFDIISRRYQSSAWQRLDLK